MRHLVFLVLAACTPSIPACGSTPLRAVTSAPPAPHPVPGPVQAGRIRVMTYNVNFGGEGDPKGVEAVASAAPDIVLFQETTPAWEAALVAGLGEKLPHHHFEDTTGHWAAGGMGFMSKWPITKVEKLEQGGEPFYAMRAIVDAPGGPIQLLNLHLRPPMSDGGSWVVGYWSTRDVREREARSPGAHLDLELPTIIAGDFNEEDDGRGMAVFRELGFANTLTKFHPNALTWQWPISSSVTLRFRLDHVMHDDNFTPVAAGVVTAGVSDHYPVWADLERR